MLPQASRAFRKLSHSSESSNEPEALPFLQDGPSQTSLDLDHADLEAGLVSGHKQPKVRTQPCSDSDDEYAICLNETSPSSPPRRSKWEWRWRVSALYKIVVGRRASLRTRGEKITRLGRGLPPALRGIFRVLCFLLMVLGFCHFIALACELWLSFFPNELPCTGDSASSGHFLEDLGHWPTDITADIKPVDCHSHNDYWRKEPLFSALYAGCTSVEPDVWLYNDDLYVGHSTASLTPARTLRSLYIDPLLNILNQTNPITSFHPSLKLPRNGVFDTNPRQTLILLIDFKNDGEAIWPYVDSQLQPLRNRNYLTYWNGTSVFQGPITVVVTGNAPFHKVVENQSYCDMFFDAPLDLMDKVPLHESPQHRISDEHDILSSSEVDSRGGQGHSGSAPTNPMLYSPANSFYASVSFKRSILHFPTILPWRNTLTQSQIDLIKKQIAGAHARGLKVRYWSVPDWPRGLRNYLWRVLVKEGVDYLNVDDLKAATTETWVGKQGWEGRERGWWFTWS